MEFNPAHLDSAFHYNDQSYYITREPRYDNPGDKFLVFHKNESGYTYIGTYLLSKVDYNWGAYCRYGESKKRFKTNVETIEEIRTWILEQYGIWLQEQFDKAFS